VKRRSSSFNTERVDHLIHDPHEGKPASSSSMGMAMGLGCTYGRRINVESAESNTPHK
jgi:hypothetical protein